MSMDEIYMTRCIELARLGLGRTAPNPMVGAVVVHGDRIIGEGYHQKYGGHHAEVLAIEMARNKALLSESTLYVSLEPCCHYGKTPPCTNLIIENKIPRVVIGTADPFDAVAGKGIARLRSSGCEVIVGVLKEQCRQLNKRFFTFHEKKRPYVILKWAQTADGFIDTERLPSAEKKPTWITSEKLRVLVHKWRAEEPAILVGTNTALKDNPRLNVRDWSGPSPLRIVIDRNLSLHSRQNLLDNSQPTWVINEKQEKSVQNTHYIRLTFNKDLFRHIFDMLYHKNIQSIIIEGGRKILQSIIDDNMWDEARVFVGTQFFGKGIRAPEIPPPKPVSQIIIGMESFFCFKNQ